LPVHHSLVKVMCLISRRAEFQQSSARGTLGFLSYRLTTVALTDLQVFSLH